MNAKNIMQNQNVKDHVKEKKAEREMLDMDSFLFLQVRLCHEYEQ